jgi:hypothetical protein
LHPGERQLVRDNEENAPPWHDEDLAPAFADSIVLELDKASIDSNAEVLRRIDKKDPLRTVHDWGTHHPSVLGSPTPMNDQVRALLDTEPWLTLLQFSVLICGIPSMRAILRKNRRFPKCPWQCPSDRVQRDQEFR